MLCKLTENKRESPKVEKEGGRECGSYISAASACRGYIIYWYNFDCNSAAQNYSRSTAHFYYLTICFAPIQVPACKIYK